MGAIKTAVINGVNTIFNVLQSDAVKDGEYVVIVDDGFSAKTETSYTARVILDKFTQEDVSGSSFADLIQPTDTKGMVPGEDLTVTLNTSNYFSVEGRRFSIVAFETDPFEAMYTLLLRDSR